MSTGTTPNPPINQTKLLLSFVIVLHFTMIVLNSASFLILPFSVPWYVAAPLCSTIVFLGCTRDLQCPLTTWENSLRGKLDMPPIKGFIRHYFLRKT